MQRFVTQKKRRSVGAWISVLAFGLVLVVFLYAVSAFSQVSLKEQQESLERALNRSITQCYALEGKYPESLSYLKENYGITYDDTHFYVDYQITASNIRPEVTIIPYD